MKCISCGKEEFDEGDVKVEGKLYGIKIKIGKEMSSKRRKLVSVGYGILMIFECC